VDDTGSKEAEVVLSY